MIELRKYQRECVDAINSMEKGTGLVSMATGLGKTVIFSHLNRRGRVLILSHREELVHQPIKYYDCPCGIEQGNETSHGEMVVSASVQSLLRRLNKFSPDAFDTIITDEAHHAAAPSYKKIYSYFKPRLHIGFTATPNRGDKVRLDDVFEKIIYEKDIKYGIKEGFLSDVRCLRVNVGYNLNKVKTRLGDFAANELDKAINTTAINSQVAQIYKKYAFGQTIIFAASVAHAENIAAEIEGAIVVSQKTANRSKIISDFTEKKIRCIVNCMIFTEGTDLPLIETIIIARPTANASLYTQMVGRGLRTYKNKKYLTLIDCVGVSEKLDVCTAPSLLGLDEKEIPDYRREKLQGMLTELPELMEKAADCPDSWILNVQAVRLFAREQNVNIRDINWTKKPDGALVYQSVTGNRIGIKAMNELGKTKLMYYIFDEEKKDMVYSESEELELQQALDRAYALLSTEYYEEKKLWDFREYYTWQFEQATEKQLKLIKAKLEKTEWEQLLKRGRLNKGDAAQIINMLKLRSLSKEKLLEMSIKHRAEKKREELEKTMRQALKIRYDFNKKIVSNKYYALMLENDLIVTNTWKKASEIIAAEEESGRRIKYKKFMSLKEACEFLRS